MADAAPTEPADAKRIADLERRVKELEADRDARRVAWPVPWQSGAYECNHEYVGDGTTGGPRCMKCGHRPGWAGMTRMPVTPGVTVLLSDPKRT